MARLKSIAIGPGRGSAGDATYRQVRGRTIMSRRITESSSNTPLQQEQRSLFASIQALLKVMRLWPLLFFERSRYGSEVNHIQTINKEAFRAEWEHNNAVSPVDFFKHLLDPLVNYLPKVWLSRGTLRYLRTEYAYPGLAYSEPILIVLDADTLNNVADPEMTFMTLVQDRVAGTVALNTATLKLDLVSEEEATALTDAPLQTAARNGVLKCFVGIDGNLRVILPYQYRSQAATDAVYSKNPDLEAVLQAFYPEEDDYTNIWGAYEGATLLHSTSEANPRLGMHVIRLGSKVASLSLVH